MRYPKTEINHSVLAVVERAYGIEVLDYRQVAESYSKRVWELNTKSGQSYLLKFMLDINPDFDIPHHRAEVAFSDFVNARLSNQLRITKFVRDRNGNTLQHLKDDDYFYLLAKDKIIRKTNLSADEQQQLGTVMFWLHETTIEFQHLGLGTTDYMRNLSAPEVAQLPEVFPEKGFEPYLEFMQPLDYHQLGLPLTTLHGDLHQDNISFSQPPLLFDLDTLARGSRGEEIARTVTHWNLDLDQMKIFYDNLVGGYGHLTAAELELIPKLIIAQLYRKYFEFKDNEDWDQMNKTRRQIPAYKQIFGLS